MSSADAAHRRATSQGSINAALSQAPTFLPPRPRSRSGSASPTRKPLHERSNSQTNQHHGPTIRIVQDADADVYSKYPVPSEPSQILAPPRNAPGYGFERPAFRVSNGSQVATTIAKFEANGTRAPQPVLSRKRGYRHSTSTNTSDADTLVNSSFSPSSVRFSQGSTPPSSPSPESNEWEKGLEVLSEETATSYERPTIRPVPPSSSGGDSQESRPRTSVTKESATCASPTPTADQIPASDTEDNSSLIQIHNQTLSSDTDQEAEPRQPALKSQSSFGSLAFSDISYTSIEPTYIQQTAQSSPTPHEAHTVTFANGTRLNYPIVRAPTANSLRTDSANAPYHISQMQDRSMIHQWSSQLSTIQSVSGRDSRSTARVSRSFGAMSQSQSSLEEDVETYLPSQHTSTTDTAKSSADDVSLMEGNTESSAIPRPLFSPVSKSSSEKDDSSEQLDTISPLPTSAPLRMKNSGYLRRPNSDALAVNESRPSSSHSDISTFIQNSIPLWAKAYYTRGEKIPVMAAPESEYSGSIRLGTSHSARSDTPSEGNFPMAIHRPRNRPKKQNLCAEPMSLSDNIQPMNDGADVLEPELRPFSDYSTPHLRTDQRNQSRYGIWTAPSLDSNLPSTLFGRQNRQIFFFCLGFIVPLGWIIASFLPLPPDPTVVCTPIQIDAEQHYMQQFGPADDKAYQKARWWRSLNRIMSVIGTILIVTIIVLAVLLARKT